MAALERRLGAAGAARLVNEFYKVARDVAFKHDALLDIPRSADGKDVPSATRRPATDGGEAMLRVVVGLPIAGEDDAGRAIRLALALVDALDGIGSDVEPELRLALARPARRRARSKREPTRSRAARSRSRRRPAAFAHKLARQARGAEILVGGACSARRAREWNFEALPAIDLPDDVAGRHERRQGTTPTRTPIRASSARACTGCAAPRSARSGCASAATADAAARPRARAQGAARRVARRARHRAQAPDRDRRRRRRRQAHAGAHVPREHRAAAKRSSCAPRRASAPR